MSNPTQFRLRDDERTVVLIDGPNFFAGAKSLQLEVDYKRMHAFFSERSNLIQAKYYTAIPDDDEFNSIRPLIDYLDYNGYQVVTKPTKEFTDATGRRKTKGNMDIEIATDMMIAADTMQHIILFSGDGDFRYVVECVQAKGVFVTVVSTMNGTENRLIADELRRQANLFVELSDYRGDFGRTQKDKDDALVRHTANGTRRASYVRDAAAS